MGFQMAGHPDGTQIHFVLLPGRFSSVTTTTRLPSGRKLAHPCEDVPDLIVLKQLFRRPDRGGDFSGEIFRTGRRERDGRETRSARPRDRDAPCGDHPPIHDLRLLIRVEDALVGILEHLFDAHHFRQRLLQRPHGISPHFSHRPY